MHPCALDQSSLSIVRVNPFMLVVAKNTLTTLVLSLRQKFQNSKQHLSKRSPGMNKLNSRCKYYLVCVTSRSNSCVCVRARARVCLCMCVCAQAYAQNKTKPKVWMLDFCVSLSLDLRLLVNVHPYFTVLKQACCILLTVFTYNKAI